MINIVANFAIVVCLCGEIALCNAQTYDTRTKKMEKVIRNAKSYFRMSPDVEPSRLENKIKMEYFPYCVSEPLMWWQFTEKEDDDVIFYEYDVSDHILQTYLPRENVKAYEETNDMMYLFASVRFRVYYGKEGGNGECLGARFVSYIPSAKYVEKKGDDIVDVVCGEFACDFSGYVLYHNYSGELISAEVYIDGHSVGKLDKNKTDGGKPLDLMPHQRIYRIVGNLKHRTLKPIANEGGERTHSSRFRYEIETFDDLVTLKGENEKAIEGLPALYVYNNKKTKSYYKRTIASTSNILKLTDEQKKLAKGCDRILLMVSFDLDGKVKSLRLRMKKQMYEIMHQSQIDAMWTNLSNMQLPFAAMTEKVGFENREQMLSVTIMENIFILDEEMEKNLLPVIMPVKNKGNEAVVEEI